MQKPMQTGLIVAVILAVLTIVEYIFAVEVSEDTVRFLGLTIAALGKAALIVYYFMHIYRIWRAEEAH
jgi:cytochrome c oxidase subunit 4